jgi:hypothetical protein
MGEREETNGNGQEQKRVLRNHNEWRDIYAACHVAAMDLRDRGEEVTIRSLWLELQRQGKDHISLGTVRGTISNAYWAVKDGRTVVEGSVRANWKYKVLD